MEARIKVNGVKANNTAEDFINMLMEARMMENGAKANVMAEGS